MIEFSHEFTNFIFSLSSEDSILVLFNDLVDRLNHIDFIDFIENAADDTPLKSVCNNGLLLHVPYILIADLFPKLS